MKGLCVESTERAGYHDPGEEGIAVSMVVYVHIHSRADEEGKKRKQRNVLFFFL